TRITCRSQRAMYRSTSRSMLRSSASENHTSAVSLRWRTADLFRRLTRVSLCSLAFVVVFLFLFVIVIGFPPHLVGPGVRGFSVDQTGGKQVRPSPLAVAGKASPVGNDDLLRSGRQVAVGREVTDRHVDKAERIGTVCRGNDDRALVPRNNDD